MKQHNNTGWGQVHRVDQLREAMERKEAQRNASVNNNMPNDNRKYHSTVIAARLGMVSQKLDQFYAKMEKKYPNFEVINVHMVDNWQDVQAYVTYKI